MRKRINVLWLDDNSSSMGQRAFSTVLKNKGYECRLILFKTIEEARARIKSKEEKIDFFISDYNLGTDVTGLNFLVDVRKSGYYNQFFLLYSGINLSDIRNNIFNFIKKDKSLLDNLSYYKYYSTIDYSDKASLISFYTKIVEEALSRWNEFSALRGEYAAVNSLAESLTRKILAAFFGEEYLKNKSGEENTYAAIIDSLMCFVNTSAIKSSFDSGKRSSLANEWKKIRIIRNSLEHNTEKWSEDNNDYYIEVELRECPLLFEDKIDDSRRDLVFFSANLKSFFEDLINHNNELSGLISDNDFISL